MDKNMLDDILYRLSEMRKAFYSEADFQFQLAWEIQKAIPNASAVLEKPFVLGGKNIEVDIVVTIDDQQYAIELKYKPYTVCVEIDNECHQLKDQGARPISRYDFFKDIMRVENLVDNIDNKISNGFAIILSNSPKYYNAPLVDEKTIDKNFRFHNGVIIPSNSDLKWVEGAKALTKGSRKTPIYLRGAYSKLSWTDYGNVEYGFKYLMIEVV